MPRLTCLMGRAGAGKTAYTLSQCVKAESEGRNAALIVPDQFTYSAERRLAESTKAGCLFFVQVLSPQRLAHRVFQAAGGLLLPSIDKTGMAMAMRRALNAARPDMKYYRNSVSSQGFVSLMRDIALDLLRSDVTPERLYETASEHPGSLGDKLSDIALCYETYLGLTAGEYLNAPQMEALLIERLENASFLADYDIYADGFDVIEPLTLRMLATLSTVAKSVTVTFTCDESPRDAALFAPVRDSMNRLSASARDLGAEVSIKNMPREKYRMAEIEHIESELFAHPPVAYEGECEAVEIMEAPGTEQEAMLVSARIAQLVREDGYSAGDIAVISPEMSERPQLLKRMLEARGIDAALERMTTALDHAAGRLLLSALEAAGGYGEAALRALKSGYTGLDEDESDALEIAVRERGVYSLRSGYDFGDEDLNGFRDRLMLPIERLSRGVNRGRSAADYSQELYAYIEEIGLLSALAERGESQLAAAICDLLDQTRALLGDTTLRHYTASLKDGLASKEIGKVPVSSDAVSISSMGRFKGSRLRALFVIGANDGLLPKNDAPDTLISDMERSEISVYVHGGAKQFFGRENLLLYSALTEPTEKLILSYSLRDGSGAQLLPSHLIGRLRRILPGCPLRPAAQWNEAQLQLSNDAFARRALGLMLRSSSDPAWPLALKAYETVDPIFLARFMRQLGYSFSAERLPARTAAEAFGGDVSVSRLERFAACPYSHFIRYALYPAIPKEPRLSYAESGVFFHDALERFTEAARRAGFANINDKAARDMMAAAANEAGDELLKGRLGKSAIERLRIGIIKAEACEAAQAVIRQIQNSRFRPTASEARFGGGGMFPELLIQAGGITLGVRGRIDRLDTASLPGGRYARIIDYKTGGKDLRFSDVYHGVSQQLLTYLDAVAGHAGLICAGAFYLKATGRQQRLKPNQVLSADELRRLKTSGYRLEGIVLGESEAFEAMCLDGAYEDTIGIALKRDGTPKSGEPVLSGTEFETLRRFVRNKQGELGASMMAGVISAEPLTGKNRQSACDTCDMRPACLYYGETGHGRKRAALSEKAARELILGGSDGS